MTHTLLKCTRAHKEFSTCFPGMTPPRPSLYAVTEGVPKRLLLPGGMDHRYATVDKSYFSNLTDGIAS